MINPMQMMSGMMGGVNPMGGMMGGGNPMMQQLLQAIRGGQDPIKLLQQMAPNNPKAAQAAQAVQGKSPQQMRQMAENLARERGVKLEDIASQFGMNLPK